MRFAVTVAIAVFAALVQIKAHAGTYDTSPALVQTAHERSDYYTADGNFEILSAAEFLEKANRDLPVVVHAHGCYGIGHDDKKLMSFLKLAGVNVVLLNFIKRGAAPSCDRKPQAGGWPETSNPARIDARRLELEHQIAWLKQNNFTKVFVSGHSEGGRVVQGTQAEVRGVFVHGMDCKPERMQFWRPNSANKVHVFNSSKDPWLNYPQSRIAACRHLFNRSQVNEYWTDIPTHSPLVEQSWEEAIKKALHE